MCTSNVSVDLVCSKGLNLLAERIVILSNCRDCFRGLVLEGANPTVECACKRANLSADSHHFDLQIADLILTYMEGKDAVGGMGIEG